LIDETAPVFTAFPEDMTIECQGFESLEAILEYLDESGVQFPEYSDNCDSEPEFVYEPFLITEGLECPVVAQCGKYFSVTDQCGNVVERTFTVTIIDTTAPEFEYVPAGYTTTCEAELVLEDAYAYDVCSSVEVSVSEQIIDGDCANAYTMIRTFTATDACGNEATAEQVIEVIDETAPEFTFVPNSNEYSCDAMLPMDVATAADNCGDAEVTSFDQIIEGDCPQAYTLIRTWVATDACGNSSEAQTTYYVYDNQAPVFTTVLTDVVVECASDVPAAPVVEAVDNCGTVTISETSSIEFDECGNYFSVHTYYAVDECGNEASPIYYTITVQDVTAPEFDQELPSSVVLDCTEEVPAAVECTATDNCNGEVMVTYSEEMFGDLPAEGSIADCVATTPLAYADGETCNGTELWSVVLFNFDGSPAVYYSTLDANFVQYPDGTATLTGSVVRNDDPSRGWNITVNFASGMDWSEWSTQSFPTGYKDDCNLSGNNHFDWTYYIMQAGANLTGWGADAGSTLNLAHAPSNLYYGYQVGVAANNVNVDYGSGGWFTYNGVYQGESITGSGDFAFDHDCCPQYSIERTWCAVDCSGNETCFTQVISFEDQGTTPPVVGGDFDEANSGKGDFILTKIVPNPAADYTKIMFQANTNNTVRLEVFDMNGRVVAVLYEGNITKGENYSMDLRTSEFQSGMYTVRLSSLNHSDYQKLVVTR
jgi:hypothetical protein